MVLSWAAYKLLSELLYNIRANLAMMISPLAGARNLTSLIRCLSIYLHILFLFNCILKKLFFFSTSLL